ncbi:MAG TPA: hypothetical protein VLW45_10000 [Pelomicrobium sp.]|nr:hypothetical protein [Pelomicrobium sp.]
MGETITVMAVIAVLATIALPRFLALRVEAREAKAQGIYGAIRSGSALAHAGCLANLGGNCTRTGGTLDLDGAVIEMVNGYPSAAESMASPGGILLAAQLTKTEDAVITRQGDTLTIDLKGGAPGQCSITYTEAGPGATPTISINIGGC